MMMVVVPTDREDISDVTYGRLENRRRAQIGFNGKGYAQGHEDQADSEQDGLFDGMGKVRFVCINQGSSFGSDSGKRRRTTG